MPRPSYASELLFRQHHLQCVEDVVYVLLGDDERRLEGHDVAGDAVFADDEAAVFEGFKHVVEFGCCRALVGVDEFGAGHEAEAADVADNRVLFLQLPKACAQLLAALRGVFAEVVRLDVVEDGEAGRGRDGVAAERRGARAGVGVGDFGRRDERGDRRAVAEGLGAGHDIRHDVEVLDGKHLARAAKARLDFVGDKERIMLLEDFLHALKVALRRHDDAGVALNGLGDERTRVACRARLNEVFDGVRTREVAGVRFFAERAAVAVGVRGEVDAADRIFVRAPHLDARDAHAELRAAVQAVPECDNLAVMRVNRSEQQRAFRGFGARRAEERFLQVARCDLGEAFGEVDEVFRQINVADVLQRADLLLHFLRDFRIAVAAVHDGHAGEAVEVFAPLAVVEVLHLAADDFARMLVKMPETRHDVFFLLLDDGFRSNVMLFSQKNPLLML